MSLKSGLSGAGTGAAIGSAIPVLGTGVGALIGGIAGLFGGGDDDNGQAEAQQRAIDAINSLDIDDLSKQVMLQQYQQNGHLDPEMIQHLNLNADQKQILTEAPENRANQQYAMEALRQMSQTGMSAQDLAQMQALRSQVAQDTGAKTNQLLQQSQMRGTLDSGDTLAAQLMANQQGSQQASKDAINVAAAAADARKQALSQYGNMAGQVRGQDYETQKANMENELARQRFLDTNSLGRQTANVGAQNNANMYNLQRQQTVGDTNVGASNAEAQRSANLKANLAAQKASALAGVYGGQSKMLGDQAAANAQSNTNMWAGAANLAGSLGKAGVFGSSSPSVKNMSYDEAIGADNARRKDAGRGMAHGGEVEGEELVHGDSEMNDIVPILASAGEFVIPKSKMKDSDSAKEFIDKHFKQKKQPSKHEALLDLIAELHSKKSKE
jgi:hypothetical protein